MIDWVVAEWIAGRVAGSGPRSDGASGASNSRPLPDLSAIDLNALALDAERRVVSYTGLVPDGPIPPPEGVSRLEWIQSNISSTRAMMDPIVGRVTESISGGKAPSLVLAASVSVEVGLLIGYLGSRVLGQYELVLLEEYSAGHEPRLLLVLPNLSQAVGRMEADELEFVTWVTLHEVTHAVQFGAVPWLREHLAGIMRQMMDGAQERMSASRKLSLPSRESVARVAKAARSADLVGMVASDRERGLLDSAQAVMAVVEGHAEHVMDAVAPDLLPSLPQLRARLDKRRKNQKLPAKVISRLLGMDMKMRQYEQGKIFCDAVVRSGGTDALRYVFDSPASLPTLAEIQDPGAWLVRVATQL